MLEAEDSECAPFDAHVWEVSVQDILDTLFVQDEIKQIAPIALHNTTLKHQAKTDEAKKAVIAEEASRNIIIASPSMDDKIAFLTKKVAEFNPRVTTFWNDDENVSFLFVARALDFISTESGKIAIMELLCNAFLYSFGQGVDESLQDYCQDSSFWCQKAEDCNGYPGEPPDQCCHIGTCGNGEGNCWTAGECPNH
ncbi:hypothetical protein SUGI_1138360 [Cryptomeria japonica]|nr:hypothetical protein SUGI_1138360 [Cryptomeria japonica]